MAPIVLSEFSLAVDIHGFLDMFWTKPGWYEEFLVGKLLDLSVNIGEWAPSPEQPTAQARTVRSYHPSKISFPGLPSHAEVINVVLVTSDVYISISGDVVGVALWVLRCFIPCSCFHSSTHFSTTLCI